MQRYSASTELPGHLSIGVTVGRLKRSVTITVPAVIVAGLFTERSTTKGPAMKAAIIAGCVVLSVLGVPRAHAADAVRYQCSDKLIVDAYAGRIIDVNTGKGAAVQT